MNHAHERKQEFLRSRCVTAYFRPPPPPPWHRSPSPTPHFFPVIPPSSIETSPLPNPCLCVQKTILFKLLAKPPHHISHGPWLVPLHRVQASTHQCLVSNAVPPCHFIAGHPSNFASRHRLHICCTRPQFQGVHGRPSPCHGHTRPNSGTELGLQTSGQCLYACVDCCGQIHVKFSLWLCVRVFATIWSCHEDRPVTTPARFYVVEQ